MTDLLQQKCITLETNLATAQARHGPESIEVATALEQYAEFLRTNKTRLLDAANMEARARVIRRDTGTEAPTLKKRRRIVCAKCEGPSERGIAAPLDGAMIWRDAPDEPPAAVTGAARTIVAYRCTKCGYLEFYA